MTVLIQDRTQIRHHLSLKCPCGRSLRARPDQAGSEISCWDCHTTLKVPIQAAPGAWVARLLQMGARQLIEARTCTLLLIGAAVVTAALLIPGWGVLSGTLALAVVMTGYGELLRRGSQGDWAPRVTPGPAARVWRACLCLSAGLALMLPLIVAERTHSAPRLTWSGLAIGSVLLLGLPPLMLATYGARGTIGERLRMIGGMLARHPLAVVLTILIVPLSLVLIEAILFGTARISGMFGFLMLDLYPKRLDVVNFHGYPFVNKVDFRLLSNPELVQIYTSSLRGGQTLIGAIPASLALGTSNGYDPFSMSLSATGYLVLRTFFTAAIVTIMLAILAVQARWLGLLSTMDSRRSAV